MVVSFFIKGLIIGFSLALPVGPIALLCIRRTLARGPAAGIASGLGAACADLIFGAIAGFGVSAVADFLVEHQVALRLVGGVFLCYLGVRIFRSVPRERTAGSEDTGLVRYFASAFVLTLTNPITLFAFAAIFATSGVGLASDGFLSVALLVLGVFAGSALWWLVLSGVVSIFHRTISLRGIQIVNRISGTLIAVVGVIILISIAGLANHW
ncbi:MAG: LysE family transporter [Desulfomonile tiedjei]|nr:LysE family transporter [Desulfomonile tiedjei]